jgi:hypothetical protein
VQQSAKVSGPHVIYDSENSADLFGFGRQYPQIGRDLRLKGGPAACGLTRAHDTLQHIRILAITSVD